MQNGGSQRPSSQRKQDAATFSDKLPSTDDRFASHASACPSFRIYYYNGAAAGSIPFEWETHPGTPKHPSSELPPPRPLTPPPSHFSFSGGDPGSKKPMKKKIFFLALIHTMRFLLPTCGPNNNKVKKLSPSVSERVLIGDEYHYHLFKFQRKRKFARRFSSFDSSTAGVDGRSRATSRTCFMW